MPADDALRQSVLALFDLFSIKLEEHKYSSHYQKIRSQASQVRGHHAPPQNSQAGEHHTVPIALPTVSAAAPPPPTVTFLTDSDRGGSNGQTAASSRGDHRGGQAGGGEEEEAGGDYSQQQVQVVQTDSGEILLVTCDPIMPEPDR